MPLNRIDEATVRGLLKTKRLGNALLVVDKCTSTNDLAAEMADNGAPDGLVVIAQSQTAGRGRLGRRWCSPRGGVWMSVLLKPHRAGFLTSLPLIGALSITKALVETFNVNARVRWPNDVVVDRLKVAGALAEAKSVGDQLAHIVLGMGVNANFDAREVAPIARTATSLSNILGHTVVLEDVISAILEALEGLLATQSGVGTEVLDLLRTLDCSCGSHVRVETTRGVFDGLLDDYESLTKVRIETKNGPVVIETGSVLSVDYQSD